MIATKLLKGEAMFRILPGCICAFILTLGILGIPAQAKAAYPEKEKFDLTKLCWAYVNHQPVPDVTYEEGVDAYGHSVTPADLNSTNNIEPEQFVIPVTIDLGERLGIDHKGVKEEAIIGILSIFQGIVHFNDRPLSDYQNSAFLKECEKKGF